MPVNVNFPKSGMGIDEGTLVRWLKHRGEFVEKGEVIAEMETAKAFQEIQSPASGRIAEVFVAEGQVAVVNSVLATIE